MSPAERVEVLFEELAELAGQRNAIDGRIVEIVAELDRDELCGRRLPVEHLSVVGLDLELAVTINVLEMRLHSVRVAPAAGNLHEHFLGTAARRAHARGPARR